MSHFFSLFLVFALYARAQGCPHFQTPEQSLGFLSGITLPTRVSALMLLCTPLNRSI